MTAPAIALMSLTILLVWGGLVASVVMLQILPVPTDEETEAAQRASRLTPYRLAAWSASIAR